jgi:hypothetical protein
MDPVITRLLKRLDCKTIELEIEEELRLHIELLEREHIQQGMSPAEAKVATLKRFGDLEKTKNQCLEISRRNHPLRPVLKAFFVLVALTGFVVHILSTDPHVAHVGGTLIAIAVSGRLFLYARGLSPSSFRPQHQPSSLLMLDENIQTSITPYD